MDLVNILPTLPLPIAILGVVYILGRTVLAIIKILAESRAKRQDAETRIKELDSQSKTEIARVEAEGKIQVAKLEADAKVNTAQLELEKVKQQAVTQQQQIEREAKMATENDSYRAQADTMRLAQATALQETVKALSRMASGQKGTDVLIKGSEKRLGQKVEESGDATTQSLEEFKDLFIMTIDMMMEDPRATYERIKRMQKAWAEGDMEKAQAVADEGAGNAAAVHQDQSSSEAKEEIVQP